MPPNKTVLDVVLEGSSDAAKQAGRSFRSCDCPLDDTVLGLLLLHGLVTYEQIAQARAVLSAFPFNPLTEAHYIAPEVIALVMPDWAWNLQCFPLGRGTTGNLIVGIADPFEFNRIDTILHLCGSDTEIVVVPIDKLMRMIKLVYPKDPVPVTA